MKLKILYVAVMILFLFFVASGCGIFAEPIKSFEGPFESVEETNEIVIDCSSAAKRNDNSATEEGYNCVVEVTENTTIRTENGQKLSVDDLNEWEFSKLNSLKMVRIVLSEEKNINKSKSSREGLEASEIIILNSHEN